MTKNKAKALVAKLALLCNDNGAWIEIKEVYRPDLKRIVVEVSIKVDE